MCVWKRSSGYGLVVGLLCAVLIGCSDTPSDDDVTLPGETPQDETSPPATATPAETATPTSTPAPTLEPSPSPTSSPTSSPTPADTGTPATATPSPGPVDADDDGYATEGPPGSVDCDDTDPSIYPGADEVAYDHVDQDCNGSDLIDVDDDGYAPAEADGTAPFDCDDDDPSAYPGAAETPYDDVDQDCDGEDLDDVDQDGFDAEEAAGTDCDDEDQATYPGAPEIGDGADNDCDGSIDEGVDSVDNDGDGASELQGDCDDDDPSVHPGATEVPYDGIDQDCSGKDLNDLDGDGSIGGSPSGAGPDCDDDDPGRYPGATEVPYDGVDQNCDGVDPTDLDGDGANGGDAGTDCDDEDKSIYPGAKEVPYDGIDQDCSGQDLVDVDGDGYAATQAGGSDCNDADASIHPSASESCNGKDEDCGGAIDEGVTSSYYQDLDGDGYGNPSKPVQACSQPSGYVSDNTDCKDTSDDVHPGALEVCNSIDDDCDGTTDEGVTLTLYRDQDGDGYGATSSATKSCTLLSGYVTTGGDCDDTNASIHPLAVESCNTKDDDCDGTIDEGVQSTWYRDQDGDGYGNPSVTTQACSQPSGYVANASDCRDTSDQVYPGALEVCNSLDDDCDGAADEGTGSTWYKDGDNDGYGTGSTTTQACSQPSGYVSNSQDCNDADAKINPSATETCNTVDDDCDGSIDEGVQSTYYLDADGDGYGNSNVTVKGCSAPTGFVSSSGDCNDGNASVRPGATETGNGVDDDCDGSIDEGVYFTSCKTLKAAQSSASSGVYTIDPDGSGSQTPFDVYCDMTTDGGGWTVLSLNGNLSSHSCIHTLRQDAPACGTTPEPGSDWQLAGALQNKVAFTEMLLMAYNGPDQPYAASKLLLVSEQTISNGIKTVSPKVITGITTLTAGEGTFGARTVFTVLDGYSVWGELDSTCPSTVYHNLGMDVPTTNSGHDYFGWDDNNNGCGTSNVFSPSDIGSKKGYMAVR